MASHRENEMTWDELKTWIDAKIAERGLSKSPTVERIDYFHIYRGPVNFHFDEREGQIQVWNK